MEGSIAVAFAGGGPCHLYLTIKQTALGLAPGGHKGGGADAKVFNV